MTKNLKADGTVSICSTDITRFLDLDIENAPLDIPRFLDLDRGICFTFVYVYMAYVALFEIFRYRIPAQKFRLLNGEIIFKMPL